MISVPARVKDGSTIVWDVTVSVTVSGGVTGAGGGDGDAVSSGDGAADSKGVVEVVTGARVSWVAAVAVVAAAFCESTIGETSFGLPHWNDGIQPATEVEEANVLRV